jgi:hypothetical protein
MKFLQKYFAVLLGLLFLVANLAVFAQIRNLKPYYDAAWADQYGTNSFALTRDAEPSALIGTNLYTGLTLTTNVSMTNIYFLNIKRGLVVGLTSP